MLRKLLSLLALPVAVLALTGAAQRFQHASIEFPQNFGPPSGPDANGIITATENGADQGPNCLVQTKASPGLQALTPAQFQQQLEHPFSTTEWRTFLGQPNLRVLNATYRVVDGHPFQIATIELPDRGVTTEQGMIATPSYLVIAGCFAATAAYSAYAERFETAVASLRAVD